MTEREQSLTCLDNRLLVPVFFYRSFYRVPRVGNPEGEADVKGHVAKKGDRWYAIIYEGLDPVTGKERRSWHPAGTNREEAERIAARLANELNGRNDEGRALTFGAYPTTKWLPGKKLELAHST